MIRGQSVDGNQLDFIHGRQIARETQHQMIGFGIDDIVRKSNMRIAEK